MQANTDIKVLHDEGTGRAFCFLTTCNDDAILADQVKGFIEIKSRLLIISLPTVTVENWQLLSELVTKKLFELKIRQISFVGFNSSCVVAQNIALNNSKLVRSLVLLNATTRATPSKSEKVIQKIENFLPLGLPLRKNSQNFDSKPFLQRLRCPILLLTDQESDDFIKSEQVVFKKDYQQRGKLSLKKQSRNQEKKLQN